MHTMTAVDIVFEPPTRERVEFSELAGTRNASP